jgi:hypothetical protein
MANIYIALNGDDVGSRIGEAIANDDHEGLASASSAIEGAHGNIDQWVESVGGKKVTRSGDEGIYLVPEEALGDLESIKGAYKEQSGHGLTVGVGHSMSEASKALIYGKLNGKDQVVHYDPMIEDYLSDQDADEEMPEEVPMDSDQDQPEESEASEEGEEDAQDSGNAQMAAKKPAPASVEADGNPDEADGEDDQEDDEQAEEQSEDEGSLPPTKDSGAMFSDENEDDDDDDDAETAPPGDDEGDDNQKASESPEDASVPMIDEDSDEDDSDVSEQEDTSDPDAPGSQAIDGDIDGEDFGSDKDNSEQEDQDEESGEAAQDMAMNPAQAPAQPQEQSEYAQLNEDDESNPDMDMGNESYEEEPDDALSSMIHGDMADEEAPQEDMGEEQAPQQAESQLDDELRQDIASALMAFKENKDMLEQAREQNPKLYQATITMLRSMIEMAKKLGASPEQDMSDQENQQQLNEEFPAADEEGGEDVQQGPPGTPSEQPDVGGMSTEKKQQGRL